MVWPTCDKMEVSQLISANQRTLLDFAGIVLAVLIAELVARLVDNRPAGWFVGGMLLVLSAQISKAPEERRTVPFTIVAMILTGAVAAAATWLISGM